MWGGGGRGGGGGITSVYVVILLAPCEFLARFQPPLSQAEAGWKLCDGGIESYVLVIVP